MSSGTIRITTTIIYGRNLWSNSSMRTVHSWQRWLSSVFPTDIFRFMCLDRIYIELRWHCSKERLLTSRISSAFSHERAVHSESICSFSMRSRDPRPYIPPEPSPTPQPPSGRLSEIQLESTCTTSGEFSSSHSFSRHASCGARSIVRKNRSSRSSRQETIPWIAKCKYHSSSDGQMWCSKRV